MVRYSADHMMISIIVPTLNEAHGLADTLAPLQPLRGALAEIIVVDGGSSDNTLGIAEPLADRLLSSTRGRARQMNTGAAAAQGDTLLFLHADTRIDARALAQLREVTTGHETSWGRFDVQPDHQRLVFRVITTLMNWRSCITGIATGDQAIFVQRQLFEQVGGYPDIALMEDIALSRQLKSLDKPACIRTPVTIAMRYWEQHGILRSMLRMWQLRLAYFFDTPPEKLHRRYYRD